MGLPKSGTLLSFNRLKKVGLPVRRMQFHPLFTTDYLLSHWGSEFESYIEQTDARVLDALKKWNGRDTNQSETQLEGQFIQVFFRDLWGYIPTGTQQTETEYTLVPQYPVQQVGQSGGTGKAD